MESAFFCTHLPAEKSLILHATNLRNPQCWTLKSDDIPYIWPNKDQTTPYVENGMILSWAPWTHPVPQRLEFVRLLQGESMEVWVSLSPLRFRRPLLRERVVPGPLPSHVVCVLGGNSTPPPAEEIVLGNWTLPLVLWQHEYRLGLGLRGGGGATNREQS